MSQPLTVMGLDPGTVTCGYGVIQRVPSKLIHVDNGLATAPAKRPLHERLSLIFDQLTARFERFSPDVVVVETVFTHLNPRSAIHLGHARGVVLLAATRCGAEVMDYAPAQVKKTVAGTGRATKYQVQMMVKALLGLPAPPAEDAADALALAICHCHHETENSIRDRVASRSRRSSRR